MRRGELATAMVTVRGAGLFGLVTAWELVRLGASVQVVDPRGAGAGASGGIVGALAPHVPENWNAKKAFQLDSLLASEAFWGGVEAASGLSTGYGRLGRLQPLADAHAVGLAQGRAEGARALWAGQAVWEVIPAKMAGPLAPLTQTGLLIRDTLTARIHPRQAIASLAKALEAYGVPIRGEAPDQGAVVWATGHEGLAALSRHFGKTVGAGVKGQAVLVQADHAGAPQVFADGLHIVPHADGTVAIGSTSEREFTDGAATVCATDALHARAARVVPSLVGAPVLERWAGIRPRARTRAPMLGPWPGRAGHFVANGGFKIGFGIAPAVAQMMADLVLGGRDGIPSDFRVEASLS